MENQNKAITAPHDLEAEKGVLGSIMHHQDNWHGASGIVSKGMFYSPIHQRIFGAIEKLIKDSERNALR